MSKTKQPSGSNPVAKSLRLGMNQPKIVKAKKGKGSYKRKGKLDGPEVG